MKKLVLILGLGLASTLWAQSEDTIRDNVGDPGQSWDNRNRDRPRSRRRSGVAPCNSKKEQKRKVKRVDVAVTRLAERDLAHRADFVTRAKQVRKIDDVSEKT